MDIVFKNKKLKKVCSDQRTAVKTWGQDQAKRLRVRLDNLQAAEHLGVLRMLPGRCHELKGDKEGELSLDLVHPYRLIFEPAENPVPEKDDGGLDWDRVKSVRILGVEDTHG